MILCHEVWLSEYATQKYSTGHKYPFSSWKAICRPCCLKKGDVKSLIALEAPVHDETFKTKTNAESSKLSKPRADYWRQPQISAICQPISYHYPEIAKKLWIAKPILPTRGIFRRQKHNYPGILGSGDFKSVSLKFIGEKWEIWVLFPISSFLLHYEAHLSRIQGETHTPAGE